MKKLLFLGAILVLIFALSACGDDDAMPSLPGSVIEAPFVTEAPIDIDFNWADLFDDNDEDEDEFVWDFGEEVEDNTDLTFNFGETFTPIEEIQQEIILEHGIPLEGTNADLAGLVQATPGTELPLFEPTEEVVIPLPPIEVVEAVPVIEVSFEESEVLPQTNDPWSPKAIGITLIAIASIVLFITKRRSSKPSN